MNIRTFVLGMLLIATSSGASLCPMAVNENAAVLSSKILDALEAAEDLPAKVAEITTQHARLMAALHLSAKKTQLDDLRKTIRESRSCFSAQCLLAYEQRASLGFQLVYRVFLDTARSESEVQDMLLSASVSRPALHARLQQHYQQKFFSFQKLVARFASVPQLLRLEALRKPGVEGEDVRRHLRRNLSGVLAFQIGGQAFDILPKLMNDPASFDFFKDIEWAIFVNTIVMMSVQAEAGAKSTPRALVNERELTSFEGFLVNLPNLLHGEKGYWRETKESIGNFAAVMPLDILALTGFRLLHGYATGEVQDLASMGASLRESLTSMNLFLGYLVLRWSFFDYKVSLRLVPAYQRGLVAEREAIWSDFKARHGLPKDLDLKTFRRDFNEATLKAFDQSVDSEDLSKLASLQFRSQVVNIGDYAWRYGIQVFDALFLFSLF